MDRAKILKAAKRKAEQSQSGTDLRVLHEQAQAADRAATAKLTASKQPGSNTKGQGLAGGGNTVNNEGEGGQQGAGGTNISESTVNHSQKRWEDIYGIFRYEDQNGYLRLAIDKNRKRLNPVYTFHCMVDGHAIIRKLIRDFNLCPKLCFLQKDTGKCEGVKEEYCYGACEQKELAVEYNARIKRACDSLRSQPSFAIIDKGLNSEDKSCILVIEGEFYGMGYIPADAQITDPETLKEFLTVHKENSVIRNLINGYVARFPGKVLMLNQAIDNFLSTALTEKFHPN